MRDEKIRLGGMALTNGVLVHGPHAWACAVRGEDGGLKVASEHKRFRAAEVRSPILRGPARIAEIFAVLPQVRRRLPEATLPFQRPQVLAAMGGTALVVRSISGAAFTSALSAIPGTEAWPARPCTISRNGALIFSAGEQR